MCPLWNRASSLASSGGISSRTGSGTEEIYSNQSTPAQSSGGSSFWDKHSGKIGKGLSGLMSLAGTGIGAYFGGPAGAAIGNSIANAGKEVVASFFDDNSNFAKGLTNKKTNEGIDKAVDKTGKAYEIYKDDKLDKTAKLKAFNNLMNSNVADTSNGHIPVGYSAASSQGATVPSGSMSLKKALDKFEKKANKKKDAIKKAKANKAKKVWDERKKKQNNKKKTKQNKHK